MMKLDWKYNKEENVWVSHLDETYWDDPVTWKLQHGVGNLWWIYENDKLLTSVQYLETAKQIAELITYS